MKRIILICLIVLCVLLICQLVYQSNYHTPTDELALRAFLHIEPGVSNYKDVYEICEDYPMMLTTSAYGMNLKITASEERFILIKFDADLIVISIEYSRAKL